jgi:integral membrane protein (TIGR01906 family)
MNFLKTFSKWLITITLPFMLIMLSIRILFTPLFLKIEYNMPGFPPDPYGFTTAERLSWGTSTIKYMFNNEGVKFLDNLRFDEYSSIYNPRETSHLVDVKNLLHTALNIFYALCGLYLVLIGIFISRKWMKTFWLALSNGGWLTVGLIAIILVSIAISFDSLFTNFHRIFFTGDTWLFYYSDTLIRLFPMRLWQDAFIAMGVLTGSMALFFALFGRKKS